MPCVVSAIADEVLWVWPRHLEGETELNQTHFVVVAHLPPRCLGLFIFPISSDRRRQNTSHRVYIFLPILKRYLAPFRSFYSAGLLWLASGNALLPPEAIPQSSDPKSIDFGFRIGLERYSAPWLSSKPTPLRRTCCSRCLPATYPVAVQHASQRLRVLLGRALGRLVLYEQTRLPKFHRQLAQVVHAGKEPLFPNQGHMAFASVRLDL